LTDDAVLDNPAWAALHGRHARFAVRRGDAVRYDPDVAPFVALADAPGPGVWDDLTALVGAGNTVTLIDPPAPPAAWSVLWQVAGVQMIDLSLQADDDGEAVLLGADDVPAMLALVARTKPGPFLPRTYELGRYLGIKRDGELIAMAGERLQPPGWTEISAVCTDDRFRGQGLASRLVRAVAAGINERGDRAFLHASASNTGAIRLYESMGFVLRRKREFTALQVPAA
jgi:ribosomal protein S18 acetylase RimI-like enzyme